MTSVLWMGTETDCNLGKIQLQTSSSLSLGLRLCTLNLFYGVA